MPSEMESTVPGLIPSFTESSLMIFDATSLMGRSFSFTDVSGAGDIARILLNTLRAVIPKSMKVSAFSILAA